MPQVRTHNPIPRQRRGRLLSVLPHYPSPHFLRKAHPIWSAISTHRRSFTPAEALHKSCRQDLDFHFRRLTPHVHRRLVQASHCRQRLDTATHARQLGTSPSRAIAVSCHPNCSRFDFGERPALDRLASDPHDQQRRTTRRRFAHQTPSEPRRTIPSKASRSIPNRLDCSESAASNGSIGFLRRIGSTPVTDGLSWG